MGSRRLPGKVLKEIQGKPLIWHIAHRVSLVNGLDSIVLATTVDPLNDPMENYATSQGWLCHREVDEDDIAGRMYHTLTLAQADAILKVNGDCLLIDPQEMNLAFQKFESDNLDYLSNKVDRVVPWAASFEIISKKAITWAHENLETAEDRELTANYIKDRPDQFKSYSFVWEDIRNLKLNEFDLTIDTAEDFEKVDELFASLFQSNNAFGLKEFAKHLGRL